MSGDLLEFCFFINLIVYWNLKPLFIMAKFELKFIASDDENTNISVVNHQKEILIKTESDIDSFCIYLDKSTAIKFAKTLRTEINKITEVEGGYNG